MKKILLTGATGFVGSNILENFYKDNQIFVLIRRKPRKKKFDHKNIFFIKFDNFKNLNNKLKKLRIDIVIHCATYYVKHHEYKDVKKLIDSNIFLGNILLENLSFMKVKKFINFSTVWQDPYPKKDNFQNLYAVYKSSFSRIVKFYKKILTKIDFFEIVLSDTYGLGDNRDKLINTIKRNFKANKVTKIISKNLYINLLNVKDIIKGLKIISQKKTKPGQYVFKNSYNLKIFDLIKRFNKLNVDKIRVKWMSNQIIKNKILKYNQLKYWRPISSNINDIINYIKY
jgi:nucleoside-diphosphate-sugar epimerase